MTPIVGVKAYGWDWSTTHGLSMAGAAARMSGQGIDLALVQNLIDPLPGSAVDQHPPAGGYSDREWVSALREEGIRTYQSTAVFFSPADFDADPSLRPIDQDGCEFEPFGWYYGLCPTHPGYLAHKRERFTEAVAATSPDGVFLSFIRFPAFWELWLPGQERAGMREFCFCERCMRTFAESCRIDLPAAGPAVWRKLIVNELRERWTAWKCAWIGRVVGDLRGAALAVKPDAEVFLNGFGLGGGDFGNAVEEILGQRFAELDASVDHYELMFYFQILKRDPLTWIPQRVAEVRRQTRRTVLACLQGGAEYLEPMYRSGGRKREISAADWEEALRGVARSGADGLLVYSWRDLLADEATGGSRVEAMRRYKDGSIA